MGAGMIRVDRGDGKLFQFHEKDVQAFIAANRGAHRVPGRGEPALVTAAEMAATAALSGSSLAATEGLETMSKAELEAYAAEHGIDLGKARTNAQRREAIQAAGG